MLILFIDGFIVYIHFQGLVYRYDVTKSDDGVGGEEGTFCLCTLW
jgi:GH15 family glucan-1,4-alpha-glucosidase